MQRSIENARITTSPVTSVSFSLAESVMVNSQGHRDRQNALCILGWDNVFWVCVSPTAQCLLGVFLAVDRLFYKSCPKHWTVQAVTTSECTVCLRCSSVYCEANTLWPFQVEIVQSRSVLTAETSTAETVLTAETSFLSAPTIMIILD